MCISSVYIFSAHHCKYTLVGVTSHSLGCWTSHYNSLFKNHCMVMPIIGLFFIGVLRGTCIVTQCTEKHIEKPTTTGTEGKEIAKSMEIYIYVANL